MNLVSFEYVACQDKKKGILVLSEFAGSATFMRDGSIPFHPANMTEMSEALYAALNLGPEERQRKRKFLRDFVNTHTRYAKPS
jgi:trehalose 6-phosphate synthase